MHKKVSVNCNIVSADAAVIHAANPGMLYGRGVFTTLAIRSGRPVFWDEHWERLLIHASRIELETSQLSKNRTKDQLLDLVAENQVVSGRARITLLDNSGGTWSPPNADGTIMVITTADPRVLPQQARLTVSPYQVNTTSPLAGIKSCNYLEAVLAFENAQSAGFDESVRLNEKGEIVSASFANIFWVKKRTLYTPSMETGCLEGITRRMVIKAAREIGLETQQVRGNIDTLKKADEIFLTSSGVGVLPAVLSQTGAGVGPITAELKKIIDLLQADN